VLRAARFDPGDDLNEKNKTISFKQKKISLEVQKNIIKKGSLKIVEKVLERLFLAKD
jgi:hypothetical protein